MTPVSIVAYLALFAGLGFGFLFVNLLVGKLVRPKDPHAEKLEVYECGEPTIGSSFVQFDLRFYVVALLFIIFDVEIAFFFPWATVYGKSTHLMDPNLAVVAQQRAESLQPNKPQSQWTVAERQAVYDASSAPVLQKFAELGIAHPTMDQVLARPSPAFEDNAREVRSIAGQVARMSLIDIGVFFAVLMVGFFYVWRRGDLDWVRAVGRERASPIERPVFGVRTEEAPVLSA
jgi:NADH-quinone oxidoreductase subunit A